MKNINLIFFLMVLSITVICAQEKFEIRLVPTNSSGNSNMLCFDTQFKNISTTSVRLSGQNYRLYYDALQLKFLKSEIQSYLPMSTYGTVDVNQDLHNIDARGYGNLKFGQNLGFINYSIRMTEDVEKIITLPSFSGWLSTSKVCFAMTDPLGPINIIWGREGLTNGYATAFTEISIQDKKGTNYPVMIQIYQDFIKLSDGTGVNDPTVLQSTQNH